MVGCELSGGERGAALLVVVASFQERRRVCGVVTEGWYVYRVVSCARRGGRLALLFFAGRVLSVCDVPEPKRLLLLTRLLSFERYPNAGRRFLIPPTVGGVLFALAPFARCRRPS